MRAGGESSGVATGKGHLSFVPPSIKCDPQVVQFLIEEMRLGSADEKIDIFLKDPTIDHAKKCVSGLYDKVSIPLARLWRSL